MTSDRRQFLCALTTALAAPTAALAQSPAMSRITAYVFSFAALDGGDIRLVDYTGKPMLIVNTASQCGYTPQFTGLQQLYGRHHEQGLEIIGVPSNDFGGANPHPFYKWAAAERPLEVPRWNFHKYLIGRDGRIAAVFPTAIEPMDARVIQAVAKELARTG
jgi:glutathione peroxidase